jgi:hypothetical protein
LVYERWGIEATGIVGGLIASVAITHLFFSDWLVRRMARPAP